MRKPKAVALAATAVLAGWLSVPGCGLDPDPLQPPQPPGHTLAYVSSGLGNADDIFVLSADAATDDNLTNFAAYDSWPAWSPDGTQMAFESNRDDPMFTEIYVVQVDSGYLTRLTADTGFADAQPAWSPLGNRIAFVSDRDSAGFDIYLMNTDGGSVKRLTTDAENSVQPAWSPDGGTLAFATDRNGAPGEIYVMDTTGGNLLNLTNHTASDLTPTWSPDGTEIAFMSDRDSSSFAIFIMNATGGNVRRVSPAFPPCGVPSWSPDGARLAFECDADVYVVNTDGTGLSRITRTGNTQRSETQPRWKPVP